MPDVCTCGARLPEDARFCHKCGKPQRDEPVFEPAPVFQPIAALATPPPLPADIGFRNSIAVRIALLAAVLDFFLISVTLSVSPEIVWLIALLLGAGFLAVYLYGRLTGEKLTIRKGARMGWLTGVFCFGFALILFTLSMVSEPGLARLREEMGKRGTPQINVEQMVQVLSSPAGIGSLIVFSLVFFTLLPTAGGALGAKLLGKASR